MGTKIRNLFDLLVGTMVMLACGVIVLNALLTLPIYAKPKDIAKVAAEAKQAQNTADISLAKINSAAVQVGNAQEIAKKALDLAKNKADSKQDSLAAKVKQDNELLSTLYNWMSEQQKELNKLQENGKTSNDNKIK